jgi:hypothetical protein
VALTRFAASAAACRREAAEYLVQRLDPASYQGVLFFDGNHKAWMVRELQGRLLPRHSSPIPDSKAFAIYDDARCRGADLQLRPGAVGLLTLGPATCKDKMMQAAGRLRLLGRGQMLHFAAMPEVTAKIWEVNHHVPSSMAGSGGGGMEQPTPRHVLQWVMANTVAATLDGILQWSKQGLFFAATKGQPDQAVVGEVMQLEELYRPGRMLQPVGEVVQAISSARQKAAAGPGGLAQPMADLMQAISGRAQQNGECYDVLCGQEGVDEEMERELEQEQEQEQEQEREVPAVLPSQEQDWDYAAALSAATPGDLPSQAGVMMLSELVSRLSQSSHVKALRWCGRVFCTSNFAHTVAGAALVQDDYLRPCAALLLFPGDQLLLLSEREEDALLQHMWMAEQQQGSHSGSCGPVLTQLAYLKLAWENAQQGGSTAIRLARSSTPGRGGAMAVLQKGAPLQVEPLVAVQLFDGETVYGSRQQLKELHRLLAHRLEAAEELTAMRGKQAMLPRSDLEDACADVLLPRV